MIEVEECIHCEGVKGNTDCRDCHGAGFVTVYVGGDDDGS